jgi:2,3-bisphosphoglycerate-dependent phosphoglycerate mutase
MSRYVYIFQKIRVKFLPLTKLLIMKRLIILSIVLLTGFLSYSQKEASDSSVTNFYLIRHAEKDRSDTNNKNPHLTEMGVFRAEQWSEVLKNISFDMVYSTNYFRTRETAQPTALKNNLDITLYDPKSIDMKSFLKENQGKNVLIVGHSNTTPSIVNAIIGSNKYKYIEDDNNGNLYIITISNNSVSDKVLYINN